MDRFKVVRRAALTCPEGGEVIGYAVVNENGDRVTPVFEDIWHEGRLVRPAARQWVRRIAKRMNHKARQTTGA